MYEHFLMKQRPDPQPLKAKDTHKFGVSIIKDDNTRTADVLNLDIYDCSIEQQPVWKVLKWKSNKWPLLFFVVVILGSISGCISYWNITPYRDWVPFVFDFTTMTIAFLALIALAICVRFMDFKGQLRVSLPAKALEVSLEERQDMFGEYGANLEKYDRELTIPVNGFLGGFAKINTELIRRKNDIDLLKKVKQGEMPALSTKVNYNPKNVSIVAIHGDALVTCFWLILIPTFLIGAVIGPLLCVLGAVWLFDYVAGYTWFADSVLGIALSGLAGLYTIIAVPVAIWHASKWLLACVAGMPSGIASMFSDQRVRIRTTDGKWATILRTKSDVLAVEAYNLISREVRKNND